MLRIVVAVLLNYAIFTVTFRFWNISTIFLSVTGVSVYESNWFFVDSQKTQETALALPYTDSCLHFASFPLNGPLWTGLEFSLRPANRANMKFCIYTTQIWLSSSSFGITIYDEIRTLPSCSPYTVASDGLVLHQVES